MLRLQVTAVSPCGWRHSDPAGTPHPVGSELCLGGSPAWSSLPISLQWAPGFIPVLNSRSHFPAQPLPLSKGSCSHSLPLPSLLPIPNYLWITRPPATASATQSYSNPPGSQRKRLRQGLTDETFSPAWPPRRACLARCCVLPFLEQCLVHQKPWVPNKYTEEGAWGMSVLVRTRNKGKVREQSLHTVLGLTTR